MALIDVSTKKYPNRFAIVDAEDLERLSKWKWGVQRGNTKLYVSRNAFSSGKRFAVPIHREILGLGRYAGNPVDHLNGDTFDNRKKNLRVATPRQNRVNSEKRKGKSKYKGVQPRHGRFVARIRINKVLFILGTFLSEIAAAKAYDVAAHKHFGEFARPNFHD